GIFSPIISGLHARQDTVEMGRLYKDVSRWIFTGAFALFLVIVVFGPEVMGIFGEAFGAGVTALVVVAIAQLFSSSIGPAPRMLAMTGNQNFAMIATSASAITGVIVSFILIPRFEVMGAAIGMATAIIVENTGTMSAVKWRLGYWPFNFMWLKPLTAGAVSGAVTYFLKVTLPLDAMFGFLPVPVSVPTIMVLGGFLCVLFFGLLWLLGFSETDKEFLGTFWRVAQRALPKRFRRGLG
ncbi:MAG: polysaccharide biosynthesis C-terminal domain-containing protein, partial [Actinomycetota bacterium]|nr:polysaccharide biosynthesis C-terminal domain-containing protein [Actinomycetota bacterium]